MAKQNRFKRWIAKMLGDDFLRTYFDSLRQKDYKDYRPYNKFFFRSIKIMSGTLFIIGLLAAIFIYIESGNVYNAIALVVTIVWVTIFLRYFLWSVYHYNINYGITDKDWYKIFDARDKKNMGLPYTEEDTQAPQHNPYRSQTFGLPPGTVRGMIAFTLLFGALTLLMVSMGMEETELQNSLIRDQFEFFKTAFLMMIAFYFGDKSLRYLQKRWKDPNAGASGGSESASGIGKAASASQSPADENDADFVEEDKDFETFEEPQTKTTAATAIKKALNATLKSDRIQTKEEKIEKEFKQVRDLKYEKVINEEDLAEIIEDLKSKENIHLELPVLKAVIDVESNGRGHLKDGRAKILFEGHKFWYWLKQHNINPEDFVEGNEDILYPKWTRNYYKGGAGEYSRLARAKEIHEKSAIYSASWGLFQVLGENLEHNIKSRLKSDPNDMNEDLYKDVRDFELKQGESERYHLLDFIAFIKAKKVKGTPLINFISGKDESKYNWSSFALGYNGRGYKQNAYDEKLKKAYSVHKKNLKA